MIDLTGVDRELLTAAHKVLVVHGDVIENACRVAAHHGSRTPDTLLWRVAADRIMHYLAHGSSGRRLHRGYALLDWGGDHMVRALDFYAEHMGAAAAEAALAHLAGCDEPLMSNHGFLQASSIFTDNAENACRAAEALKKWNKPGR